MNPCFWFLVFQEFDALQTSLKHNPHRMKQRDSLPLYVAIGELRDRKSPSVVQGPSFRTGFGGRSSSEAEAFCTFPRNILYFLAYASFIASKRGHGPMVNMLMSLNQSSLPLLPFSPPYPESGRSGVLPCKIFEILDCFKWALARSGMLKIVEKCVCSRSKCQFDVVMLRWWTVKTV